MQNRNTSLHLAICDDNAGDRKQLERLLKRESEMQGPNAGVLYVDSYGNVDAAMQSPMLYDAFFIDMISGDVDGCGLARRLIGEGVASPIVFCSSSIDYKASFSLPPDRETHPIIFLYKPIKRAELSDTIDRIAALKSMLIPTIELRGEKTTRYAAEDDIVYAKAEGRYIHVYLKDGSVLEVLSTIDNFFSQLSPYSHYAAVSRSSMINVTYLKRVSFTKLVLLDDTVIRTSPSYSYDIKKALQQYVEEL